MTQLQHVMVVDDDERLRNLLKRFLTQHGYLVTVAPDAAVARELLEFIRPDLMIVDIMMPGETGIAFAASLDEAAQIPFLFLSALGESEDRISGLRLGAEDYIAKPFEPEELLLRIETILKRIRPATDQAVLFGPFRFDPATRRLTRAGQDIALTHGERELLAVLLASDRQTVSREALAGRLGTPDNLRAVDVQVTRLRRKIEENPRQPRYLQTMRGEGYALLY